jgi:hypothetical protein
MRFTLSTAVLLTLFGTAFANDGAIRANKFRFADASSDACVSNCSTQNASCKRACPATFSTPCLSACDSQAQSCSRSCQTK